MMGPGFPAPFFARKEGDGVENSNRRELIAQIAALSWPTIVEQALQTVVQFADSAMVGRIGAQASASVGMTASVIALMMIQRPFSHTVDGMNIL